MYKALDDMLKEQEKLAQQIEVERDRIMRERTEGYDEENVRIARLYGINPDNFEDEDGLKEAIEIRRKEFPEIKEHQEAEEEGVE